MIYDVLLFAVVQKLVVVDDNMIRCGVLWR